MIRARLGINELTGRWRPSVSQAHTLSVSHHTNWENEILTNLSLSPPPAGGLLLSGSQYPGNRTSGQSRRYSRSNSMAAAGQRMDRDEAHRLSWLRTSNLVIEWLYFPYFISRARSEQNVFILLCVIIMPSRVLRSKLIYRINLKDILCIKCKHVIIVNIRAEQVSQSWQVGSWPCLGWQYQTLRLFLD